jgi:multidrug efflux pump subunit AcrA (membrane-fusion protein)
VLVSPELDQQVANAHATYELSRITNQRNVALRHEGVIAAQAADESKAAVLEAEATLKQLTAMQQYKIIRAPFDGIITAREVDPGHLIPEQTAPASANTPVVTISTLSPLRVYAEMPQSVAPFVRDGESSRAPSRAIRPPSPVRRARCWSRWICRMTTARCCPACTRP